MKRHWIEYTDNFQLSPMTIWVHRGQKGKPWFENKPDEYSPPLPKPVPGLGYANFQVEFDGMNFQFSSLTEMDELIRVFSMKNMPSSTRLSQKTGEKVGPNQHWLSRLPAETKAWKYREPAVEYLKKARKEFSNSL